ncbi:Uncharacterised protein [Moraxella caviae]|uniref:Uncharacterized protein n=1 Tax=Moraxella caviae TaxID=34060 RepID=A0A378R5L0_9GAMM|nr:hypothetical protein [Moraxella caviae]STZ09937.1 Uncharacterised protein [Moraxella caviae]VEW13085.1 Uncharacterised protein [Moraxella caviae]
MKTSAKIFEMNVLSKGQEKPITSEMIAQALAKLAGEASMLKAA